MKWYTWLLGFQTVFLSGIAFIAFAFDSYNLMTDSSGQHGKMSSYYHLSLESYTLLQALSSIGFGLIAGVTVYALLKKKGNVVLILAGMFFILFTGLMWYGSYLSA